MKTRIVLLAAALAVAASGQRSADVALRAAMETETVKGDLKGAIEQYKKIAQGGNRSVAAQALLHMAECYQKLGDAEARKTYERLVKDFADQKETAAIARARLGEGSSNSGLVTRQVWMGPKVDAYGTVSPDGHTISYTDWDTGDLALHDLATGQERHLTNKGSWDDSDEWAFMSAISRDGKQVAYGWSVSNDKTDLRVMDLSGGKARVLVAGTSGVDIEPLDWSPDGKWIAVQVERSDDSGEIGLVAVADGAFRRLKSVPRQQYPPSRMTFSPDGKYLACDVAAADNPERREIHLLAVDGGADTPVLAQPANDRVAGWSADGRLLFASERTGLSGLWAQMIANGKPQGIPELIKANVNPYPLGLTRAGSLYYSVVSSVPDIYVASVDFETGNVLSGPTPLAQPFFGLNNFPEWSRDGKYLAYFSRRDANSANGQLNILVIRDMKTGQSRELHPNLRMLNVGNNPFPLWTPDESLIVSANDKQGRQGIYRVDARSGDTASLVLAGPGELRITARALSPDGKTLYIERIDAKSRAAALFARDLSSGQERELIRRDSFGRTSLSPDGRTLATVAFDKAAQAGALVTIPVDGGAPRELLRTANASPDQLGVFVEWTPDGKHVVFRKGGRPATRETFRIPAEGGVAIKYGSSWTPGPNSISPDGRQVAFAQGQHKIEIWAMENFLPAKK